MTLIDSKSLQRTAQRLVVEARRGRGSPPQYESAWQPVWAAQIERIVINAGPKPSSALLWFPDLRWDESCGLTWSDLLRIRTNESDPTARSIIFCGFIVGRKPAFSGGTEQSGSYERCAIHCLDYRWLLSKTSHIFGQLGRSPDDYDNYGQPNQVPRPNHRTYFTGRRAIFNERGRGNCDPQDLALYDSPGFFQCNVPLFCDPQRGQSWTARQMLIYCLCPLQNKAYDYLPIRDPSALAGLGHPDFDKVINHIVVDGLNILDAASQICSQLGWSFREEYYNNGTLAIVFYKLGEALSYRRTINSPIILHRLYAPAPGEAVAAPVGAGCKMLWSAELDEDITNVINCPVGMGAPDRFEFTAELVPAWRDMHLIPDTSDDNANLYFTEAALQEISAPNNKSYYRYYHPRGASFRHTVGRKWALNETGSYSAIPYERGSAFDFSTVIPAAYIKDSYGRLLFGPFARRLLSALSLDPEGINTVGIKVEFSFDSGKTWQVIPAAIAVLEKEAGIYIAEVNLAEMVDEQERSFEEGSLDGVQLNYFTSLADDSLAGRSFAAGQWHTRLRVTASVQMDMRLVRHAKPSWASGSPFWQKGIYDFSERYGIVKRTDSSILSDLPAEQMNLSGIMASHLDSIRRANENMSISGLFTLDRLWLGDGAGFVSFAPGDCIESIDGRAYGLTVSVGSTILHPEIIQIVYMPEKQKQQLITRDLRFTEVNL